MKKTRKVIRFNDLPRNFAGLCGVLTPRPIRDRADYDNAVEVTDAMALWNEDFSPDQEDYFDLLCMLIENYDKEHVKWPKKTPVETLRYLLEEHELKPADLSRILGASRMLGPMILRGERSITAEHARKLGKRFGLPAGLFIE
jgi:HTH-type transcriptional regulator/antitoxin HigA